MRSINSWPPNIDPPTMHKPISMKRLIIPARMKAILSSFKFKEITPNRRTIIFASQISIKVM